MGQALHSDQLADDVLGGSLSTEDATDFFSKAPPLVPIAGVQPYPGESWRNYNARVADMIERLRRSLYRL